jgi:hypothetical protein
MTIIEKGFCQCGCGEKTIIAKRTVRSKSIFKGEPLRYVYGHSKIGKLGPKSCNWKGGKATHDDGYAFITGNGHPRTQKNGYVLEHILIAEKALGKPLPPGAIVHHTKSVHDNGNLVICQDQAYHLLLHQRMRSYKACSYAAWRKCVYCKEYDDLSNLYINKKTNKNVAHPECRRKYQNSQYHERVSKKSEHSIRMSGINDKGE